MDTDLPMTLQIADVLVHQSRLNMDVADLLERMRAAGENVETVVAELREDIAGLAVEQGRQAARMESLTATVGRLLRLVEPPPSEPELHSVKVPSKGWYPALCKVCGHTWDADATHDPCPECDADSGDVSYGPLAQLV